MVRITYLQDKVPQISGLNQISIKPAPTGTNIPLFDILEVNQDYISTGSLRLSGTGPHFINGNLGVGTAHPDEKLTYLGLSAKRDIFCRNSGNLYQRGFSANALAVFNGSITKEDVMLYNQNSAFGDFLILKNTGNVGIGIVNPLYKLDTYGSGRFFNGEYGIGIALNDGGAALSLLNGGDKGSFGFNLQDHILCGYMRVGAGISRYRITIAQVFG